MAFSHVWPYAYKEKIIVCWTLCVFEMSYVGCATLFILILTADNLFIIHEGCIVHVASRRSGHLPGHRQLLWDT